MKIAAYQFAVSGDIRNNFEEIKKALELKGRELGVEVKIQREEIFNSMHTV